MDDIIVHSSYKVNHFQNHHHGRKSRNYNLNPIKETKTISGNFTNNLRTFVIHVPGEDKMRRDITVSMDKGGGQVMLDNTFEDIEARVFPSDNPTYEDPRDVIGIGLKPEKPPRKKPSQAPLMMSPSSSNKEQKMILKEQKKKLSKKYETLIMTLMDRCEDNVNLLNEKESQLAKLKEKLKSVLEYNKLFADENDQLKDQHSKIVKYIEDCKTVIQELQTQNRELELKNRNLKDRVHTFEVPDREHTPASNPIPLVEVCMSCSSRQILVTQLRDQNNRMHKDMGALKDVLYRLNVQLNKYQERIRRSIHTIASGDKTEPYVHKPAPEGFDSLITASLGYKHDAMNQEEQKCGSDTLNQSAKVVDLSGLLSAQALAPLFDAYQDSIQEKETLILDYEKQFEAINKKSKHIVEENRTLQERVAVLEEELLALSKSEKKLTLDRETMEIERQTLLERAEKAEMKLKEVYELYEDKISSMMRDYETVHREYFSAKSQLAAAEEKAARASTARDQDIREDRVLQCRRLLEDLKHQYSMEIDRKTEKLSTLQQQKSSIEEKYNALCRDHEKVKEELKTALKNVRLYRKAAVIFRHRLRTSSAALTALRRKRSRRTAHGGPAVPGVQESEQLQRALHKLERIKQEIKAVKTRASSSLQELERRIVQQERRAGRAEQEYRNELERARLVLDHKEGIIRSLIDKVADVEEVRLSQGNTSGLQGIVSDASDKSTSPQKKEDRREEKKLAPSHGGYYQDSRARRKASQT